jgi:hypothetical protein
LEDLIQCSDDAFNNCVECGEGEQIFVVGGEVGGWNEGSHGRWGDSVTLLFVSEFWRSSPVWPDNWGRRASFIA